MDKKVLAAIAVTGALLTAAGCAGRTDVKAYLFDDAVVGGDASRSIAPAKGILVWPLENISAGSKGKGVETALTGVFADTLNLEGGFEKVEMLEEDQAKDLLARAGEELGLKKKPKAPVDGALVVTKLGQLTGTEMVLTGRIESYDEEKLDKATLSVVAASFNLFDAREKAYTTIDSFAPVKRIWRANIKRTSAEGPLNSREALDDTARKLLSSVVAQLADDLGQGAVASRKLEERKLAELSKAADAQTDAGEYDKAVATWKEVQKIRSDDRRAKAGIEKVERLKREAEERAKAEALRKQIDELAGNAAAAEEAGDLEGAKEQWKKVLELDAGNRDARSRLEGLERRIAEQQKRDAEEAERKQAAEEEQRRTREAEEAAARAADEAKGEETGEEVAAEPEPEPEPEPPAEPAAEAGTPAVEAQEPAAAGGDVTSLRDEAMAAFNNEDYTASRDLWKKILEVAPEDKQAKEMLETTEMLLNALQ